MKNNAPLAAALLTLAGLFPLTSFAQSTMFSVGAIVDAPLPEHICTLQAVATPSSFRTALPAARQTAKSATITVTYIDTDANDPWPQAGIDAFEFAKGIWESHIQSAVPIEVDAFWKNLGGCNLQQGTVLGSAGPRLLVELTTNGQPASFYPIPLANAITGSDLFAAQNDIDASFNMDCDDPGSDNWYFGTDGNTPAGKIDFVSVVLHELGHGLGFVGSADVDNGSGSPECNGTSGDGCLNSTPFIYDQFVFDAPSSGTQLVDVGTYPNPSAALGLALTKQTGSGIFFDGPATRFANAGATAPLYTPTTWSGGSSYSHLDETVFNGTPNALMTPSIQSGESTLAPGAVTCGLFQDMGWPMGADCLALLPVSLTRFVARGDERTAWLEWETASETNNAGFEIQQNMPRGWRNIGWVAGNGTTTESHTYRFRTARLTSGLQQFRLKQIDFDGSSALSPLVSLRIVLDDSFALSAPYPNPFNPRTQFTLDVQRTQHVRIVVLDVLGRQVQEVFSGSVEAGMPHPYTVDGASLPSGAYWIRAEGERFQSTRQIALLK